MRIPDQGQPVTRKAGAFSVTQSTGVAPSTLRGIGSELTPFKVGPYTCVYHQNSGEIFCS